MKDLLESMLDGTASPQERQAFSAQLERDAELRQDYLRGQQLLEELRALPLEEIPLDEAGLDPVALAQAQSRLERSSPGQSHSTSHPRGAGHVEVGPHPSRSQAEVPLRAGNGPQVPAASVSSPSVLSGHARWMALGAAVMLLLAVVVITRFATSPLAPPLGDRALAPLAPAAGWVAMEVQGAAWVEEAGQRRPVALGDVLSPGAHVATDAGATVALGFGASARVVVEEESRIGLLSHQGWTRAVLEGGTIAADHFEGEPLEVRVRGSLQRLSISHASARVLYLAQGRAAVAVTRGEVPVGGDQGASAKVMAGQQAILDTHAVGGIQSTPAQLDLAAARGEGTWLEGRVEPGVEVRVNHQRVTTDKEGRFAVELPPQVSEVLVEARDVWGRTLARSVPMEADRSQGPLEKPDKGGASPGVGPTKKAPPRKPQPGIETEWSWEPG